MYRRIHAFTLILLTIPISSIHATDFRTLSLQFERESVSDGKIELTVGTVYYDAPKKVVIEVTHPINQIMAIDDKTVEIYYPVDGRAYRFKYRIKVPFPFIDTILRVMKSDVGLTGSGYTLEKHEVADGILQTHWQPPEVVRDTLGSVILKSIDDRIISLEIRDPKNQIVTRSRYSKHVKLANRQVPTSISSQTYAGVKVVHAEAVSFSNPQLNSQIPEHIRRFRIPKGVKVKEVKW